MFFKYTFLVVQVAYVALGADILAIVPTPSYSHQIAFLDFWKQLSLRGHKVTLVTTDPLKDETLTNLTEVDIRCTYKLLTNISISIAEKHTMWNFHRWINDLSIDVSDAVLSYHQLQDLIHDKNKHFDVVLVEWLYPELLIFGEMYNCPTILIGSMEVYTKYHNVMANSILPALYPGIGSEYDFPLSFSERVISTIYYLYSSLLVHYSAFPAREEILRKFFNSTITVNELVDNIDLMLLTLNPVVQTARAVGPTTINTGSLRDKSAKPLPKDLKEFLDNATNGFVYFSLGTNVKSKDIQAQSLNAIIETLGELPYKVLWKFEADEEAMPGKPNNVKLIKWAPQLDILAHPNIKLFVTQGGLQSMEEIIYNEVPCVVIPFLGDQQQNARLMKQRGFAEIVGRHPYIKKEDLKAAIIKVINNPEYKQSVIRLNRLSVDTPMTGLEKAIWWTEYVIRHKGAKHLRNPASDLPLYQYYLLDVIIFLVSVVVGGLLIFIVLLKRISRLFKIYSSNKFKEINKKLQ